MLAECEAVGSGWIGQRSLQEEGGVDCSSHQGSKATECSYVILECVDVGRLVGHLAYLVLKKGGARRVRYTL